MRNSRTAWTQWLAEDAGIPCAVQHLFDLAEFEEQANEILARARGVTMGKNNG